MKKSIFLIIGIVCLYSIPGLVKAQAPQSFNFQAVARDNTGELLASSDLDIRISIIANSDESLAWQESHNVTTSDLGLFTLDVGKGTRTGGSASAFDKLKWSSEKYSIKVELQEGPSWEDMGTTELLSVPYALNAASVGELKSLEVIEDEYNPVDSALFEVKNNTGNTVFAVYNEGVRVYVDDTQGKSKGPKGGFAIGGFDTEAKGTTWEYFRVTPDSVRIYLDEGSTKGPKGGFAIGGFDDTKGVTGDIMHLSEDNYFIGYLSGSSITTGLWNSFFGYEAGVFNTEGSGNILIGNTTGYNNTTGNWNIMLGNGVGYTNTIGSGNIMMGDEAGYNNTDGSWNVFIGDWAGRSNTSGESNVYIGADAGISSTVANYNVFLGSNAGLYNTEGSSNVFVGETSGYSNTTGESNVFIGTESGWTNSSGNYNVFIGESTGHSNTIGRDNVIIGASAGESNTEGLFNVFLGTTTGWSNTTGIGNVFIGQETGYLNTTGDLNVALGPLAGYSNSTGSGNVFLGFEAGFDETGSNKLYIDNAGNSAYEALIYGEFDNSYLYFYADMDIAGYAYTNDVWVKSDKNLKKNISDLSPLSDKFMLLRPVEYDWKEGVDVKERSQEGRQIGLIAQEVEEIFPEMVRSNLRGEKTINYIKLSVVLMQTVQEQQQIIEDQEARLIALENKMNQLIEK